MEADDSKYLEAGFDASVLKVSRLRSILVKHNVEFPSNAKKPELVAIFERKVAARAGKLRKEAGRARQAKGDGRSIEVVQEAPAGNVSSGVSNVSGGGKRKLSDVVDQQEEPRRRKKKSGKRRVPVTGSDADEPSALNEPEPRRKKKKVEAVAAVLLGSPRESGNFSDDNPFQAKARAKAELGASPEQRRTPRKTPKEPATTPLAALRKSQQSDVAFRVALPGARSGASESGSADGESAKDGDSKDASKDGDSKDEPEDVEMLEPSTEVETKPVQEIKKQPQQPQQPLFPAQAQAAKTEKPVQHSQQPVQPQPVQQQPVHAQKQTQQQQPIKKERHPELPPPPRFDLSRAPNEPVVSASRLTLTPEALRQMAAERRQQQPQPQQPQQPQSQQHAAKPPPMPGLAADDVHVLQRRRVATLRQHVEAEDRSTTSSAAAAAHSRRSSIASIADVVGEARGVPCEPAAAVIDSSSASAPVVPTTRRAKRPSAARRLALLVLLGLAGVGWRTHEQLQLGFRNTRAGEPAMVPPADSALTEPSRPAGEIASLESLGAHVGYVARLARARYLEPPALECPEHATCTPYVSALDPLAVQCDAGYVLQRPVPHVLRAPVCARDVPLEHRVRQVGDAIVRLCDERRGQAQCAQSLFAQARAALRQAHTDPEAPSADEADEADEVERLGVSVEELHSVLAARRAPGVAAEEFERAFALAVRSLADGSRGDALASFVVEYEDAGEAEAPAAETTYFVSRRAALPLLCRVRRLALGLLLGNARRLAAAAGAVVAGVLAMRRVAAGRSQRRAADALVHAALRRLRRQARLHYVDPAFSPSPAIPSAQLRDLLLLGESTGASSSSSAAPGSVYFDPRARTGVWDRVRAVVERSANVRCRTTVVRGEPMRVWEWIGPLDTEDAAELAEEPSLVLADRSLASPGRLSAAAFTTPSAAGNNNLD